MYCRRRLVNRVMNMKIMKLLLSGIVLLGVLACSEQSSEEIAAYSMSEPVVAESGGRARTGYLAYEHRIAIDLPGDQVERAFQQLVAFCSEDKKYDCTLLHSSLNSGEYSSASLEVRIMPDGVSPLLAVASERGAVLNQSTDAEDLQDAIVNGDKRLTMLRQYQARLIELDSKSDVDIESLIKITQELAQVQSDIEYAEGEKARLLQRTQMDIVRISLQTLSYGSAWNPISAALSGFGDDLAEGVSQVIVALAYLLPWLAIVLPLLYLLRVIWRKTRSR